MKKILVLILSLIITIPFFTFSPSAAEYTLDPPTLWYDNVYNSVYSVFFIQDEDTLEYVPSPNHLIPKMYFAYYPPDYTNIFDSSPAPIWSIGDFSQFTNNFGVVGNRFTGTKNILVSCFRGDVRNSFIVPGFRYTGIYLPSDGQYLKISFSFDTRSFNAPSVGFLDFEDLFFLIPHSTNLQVGRDFIAPNTVLYNLDSSTNVASYHVYFNLNSSAFDSFADEYKQLPFDLVIRVPYYINDNDYASVQSLWATDATFPASYEILTIGGYSQEIESVENAVVKGFDELDSILTDQIESDVIFLNEAEDKINTGKDVINDYNNANDEIRDIVEDVVVPNVDDLIKDQVSVEDDIGTTIQDLMQNTYITSALLIVFSLCLISVILYGVRG